MKREIYREKDGKLIKGTIINLLVKDERYYLVDLKIYADGYTDCLGEIDMCKLKRLFETGKLSWSMPPNEVLFIPYISYIFSSDYDKCNRSDSFIIKIIEDKIEELQNGESIETRCTEAFRLYLIDASVTNFSRLKNIYDDLPEGKKALFELPHKDPLIKLMETRDPLSREDREYYLRDYFEGEWLEIK